MSFTTLLDRLARHMPFRMTLGKLGIRLVHLGRFLQIRYANWNQEFRLKSERTPGIDHGWRLYHVSVPVTGESIISFNSANSQPNKQIPVVVSLFKVRGICRVILRPYMIELVIGSVFSYEELGPQIEEVILSSFIEEAA